MTSANRIAIWAACSLAVGDALGTTLEFSGAAVSHRSPTCSAAGRSVGAGAMDDDTSMALCLAEPDRMKASMPTTRCAATAAGNAWPSEQHRPVLRYRQYRRRRATATPERRPFRQHRSAGTGNGCLMRLAPVPMRISTTNHGCCGLPPTAPHHPRRTRGGGVPQPSCPALLGHDKPGILITVGTAPSRPSPRSPPVTTATNPNRRSMAAAMSCNHWKPHSGASTTPTTTTTQYARRQPRRRRRTTAAICGQLSGALRRNGDSAGVAGKLTWRQVLDTSR